MANNPMQSSAGAAVQVPEAGAAGLDAWSVARLLRRNPLLIAFVVMVAVGASTSEYFLTALNMENLMRSMAVPGLLALGVTFVLLVGRIDLSMGSLLVFAPIAGISAMTALGEALGFEVLARANSYVGSSTALIGLTLLGGALVGLASGIGTVYGRIASFIMTLAMMQALRGLNYLMTDGHAYFIQAGTYTWIGTLDIAGVPFSFLVYVGLSVIVALVLRYTLVGRRLYAIGGDESAAALAGINTKAWVVFTFVMSGLMAAVAGVLFTSRLQSVDAPMGVGFELTAIAFAVVGGVSLKGGKGSPYSAFLGALVMSTLLNLFNVWGLNTWYQNIATGAVVISVVMLDQLMRRNRS